MFAFERSKWLDEIEWSSRVSEAEPRDGLVALECWRYEDTARAYADMNYRRHWLANKPASKEGSRVGVEDELSKLLQHKVSVRAHETARGAMNTWTSRLPRQGPSFAHSPTFSSGKLLGGLRLILSDIPYRQRGICMSRPAFEIIEHSFDLHPFTLPSVFSLGGAMYCETSTDLPAKRDPPFKFIVRFHQKIEIGSCMLSLTHDVTTGRTDALICGHGFVATRAIDQGYGSLREQIIEAVLACPNGWNNPLLLPSILHHIYVTRLEKRSWLMSEEVIDLESVLMKMFQEESPLKKGHGRDEWSKEIDTRATTIELHTLATHITYLNGGCRWLLEFGAFLLQKEQLLRERDRLRENLSGYSDIRQSTQFLTAKVDGLAQRFRIYQERANLHVSVLFSIINQQNSALTLLDSRLNILIASSAKQDSISMTTFTFITAMFLPGTFIATIFSMSMFNWQNSNASNSPSGTADSPVITGFWIFWATAAPLTLVTMAGWYLWSKYARWKWVHELKTATHNYQKPLASMTNLPAFLTASPGNVQ